MRSGDRAWHVTQGKKGGAAWVKKMGAEGVAERVKKMNEARERKHGATTSWVREWLKKDKKKEKESHVTEISRREFERLKE
jgi:hypothetical protein